MNHRVLFPDCQNYKLMSLDLFTGERSVLIDTWPWTEPGIDSCVQEVVVEPTGERAFAIVVHWYPEPGGDGEVTCLSRDLVAIDTRTRVVTPLQNIERGCDDESGYSRSYTSMQVDVFQQRLLYVERNCVEAVEGCYQDLSSTPLEPGENLPLHSLYRTDCSSQDYCPNSKRIGTIHFDPADPDRRALVLADTYLGGEFHIDELDLATGAITPAIVLDSSGLPGTLRFGANTHLSVDAEKQRLLIAIDAWDDAGEEHLLVIAVDLVTREQRVLYHGGPTPELRRNCRPWIAFDSRARRLVLVESARRDICADQVFAVDADTGELTLLSGGTSP